jgi:hypothetical protein
MFTVFFPVLFSASATLISILRSRVDPSSTICTNRVHGRNRQWLVNRVKSSFSNSVLGPHMGARFGFCPSSNSWFK